MLLHIYIHYCTIVYMSILELYTIKVSIKFSISTKCTVKQSSSKLVYPRRIQGWIVSHAVQSSNRPLMSIRMWNYQFGLQILFESIKLMTKEKLRPLNILVGSTYSHIVHVIFFFHTGNDAYGIQH